MVKNIGQRPIKNVSVFEGFLPFGLYSPPLKDEQSNSILWLEPGQKKTVKLNMRARQRGLYELPYLLVGSSFPSGLIRWPKRMEQKDKLLVYPRFISQTEFKIPYHPAYQPGGIAVSSNIGESNEFLSTREYHQGDRLRDIHWKSFARTGKLIVKEYVEEYFIRIGLLLDTELSPGDHPLSFEQRISMAAGIADAIARKEYIIDLFAAGEELHHFQIGRATAHLENLLELLSCIEGARRVDFKKVQANLGPYIQQLSSMIVLLKDWDQPRANLCQRLKELGCSIRIILIRDKPPTLSPDQDMTIVSESSNKEGLIH